MISIKEFHYGFRPPNSKGEPTIFAETPRPTPIKWAMTDIYEIAN